MIVNLRVKYCEIMRDNTDFLLFGIEITTAYSVNIIPKRFEDFKRFHKDLSYFWNQEINNTKLLDYIPKLPAYKRKKILMRQRINNYVEAILKILQNSYFNRFHPWIKIANSFFCLKDIEVDEEEKAKRIQSLFKRFYYRKKTLETKKNLFDSLDNQLIQYVFIFLDIYELKTLKSVSKRFKFISKLIRRIYYLKKNDPKCGRFKTLNLSNSKLVDSSVISAVFSFCELSQLEFINLQDCSSIADDAFRCLSSLPKSNFALSDINLSGCRITDESLKLLLVFSNLKNLEIKNFKITDKTIEIILSFPSLETLDISGTAINNDLLSLLNSSQISNLIIRDCKNVELSNIRISKQLKIFSDAQDFVISLRNDLTMQIINIKGNKDIQVRDLHRFLSEKLNTHCEIVFKFKGKELKKYDYLFSIPQENGVICISFSVSNTFWSGLPVWDCQDSVKSCSKCDKTFAWYNRKIHCRMCGKIFCSDCCSRLGFIKNLCYTVRKVPICPGCFKKNK